MSLSFERGKHIYGRYWGAHEELPGLHFECCYHQLIDRAIERQAVLVEAGAQGEHKLKRGFLPVVTHSAHRFVHPALQDAVVQFLAAEAQAVDEELREGMAHAPFKEGCAPKHPLRAGVPLV